MAKERVTKPKVNVKNNNNIKIIGDNILYNNGIITAFYIIPLTNYSTASASGVEGNVVALTNMITNLTTANPSLTFTIERIDKTIKRKDVLANLVDTINIYRPDYEMPPEFTRNVKDDLQSYCLLGIDIQQAVVTDVEDYSLTDTVKAVSKQIFNKFAGLGNMNVDPEQLLKMENSIYRTINGNCLRATKELVFYNFVSKVFPCYEISYDKMSYINENNFESIKGAVVQTVSDNFGWFEMHNEGVDIFDCTPQTTYGCMLNVKSFPPVISSVNFPMDFPNLVTTIQCIPKGDAIIKLKRVRASDRYEIEQALEADAEIEQIEQVQESINIATQAITEAEQGEIICNFNTSILVFSQTKEGLKQNVANVVTSCKDRNILVYKSLTQALDFLDNYINKKPQQYIHMTNLSFPLSFQQNAGATVGDTDGVWSPSIGVDI